GEGSDRATRRRRRGLVARSLGRTLADPRGARKAGALAGPHVRHRAPGTLADGWPPVILEAAVLNVRDGEASDFEAAFEEAKTIIAASPGFGGLRLLRCVETTHRYILLVEWETLEDHVVGFRESEPFQEWRQLL